MKHNVQQEERKPSAIRRAVDGMRSASYKIMGTNVGGPASAGGLTYVLSNFVETGNPIPVGPGQADPETLVYTTLATLLTYVAQKATRKKNAKDVGKMANKMGGGSLTDRLKDRL